MIVKSTVYFEFKKDEDAKITNVDLLVEALNKHLEEYLTNSSFKLTGSTWDGNRIKAKFVTRKEALEALRVKK